MIKTWLKRKDNTMSIKRAYVLRKQGLSYHKIAKKLGFADSTIMRWTNPEFRERTRLYLNKYQNERYNSDPIFKRKQIKASSEYISDRMSVCEVFAERRRKMINANTKKWLKKHPNYQKKYRMMLKNK